MGDGNVRGNEHGRDRAAVGADPSLQQNEFCERARIATNTYNQFEKGKKRPSIENALRLCEAYGLTLDWIYRGDPSALRFSMADAIKALKEERCLPNPR